MESAEKRTAEEATTGQDKYMQWLEDASDPVINEGLKRMCTAVADICSQKGVDAGAVTYKVISALIDGIQAGEHQETLLGIYRTLQQTLIVCKKLM